MSQDTRALNGNVMMIGNSDQAVTRATFGSLGQVPQPQSVLGAPYGMVPASSQNLYPLQQQRTLL